MDDPASKTSTVLLASAVPETSSVLSLVMPSAAPVSTLIVVTAGADGAEVSTVTANAADVALVLPAVSGCGSGLRSVGR